MTNYTELKRLAEAAKACAHLSYYTSHEGDFEMAASPDVVLSMIAEIDKLRTQNQALVEAVTAVIEYDEINPHDGVGMMLAYADALAKCRAAQAEGGV